ncbi:MAG: hypothetical protein E4H07_07475, partial [Nitrosomonadales bacterium]
MNILFKVKSLTREISYVFFGTVAGFTLGFAQLAYAEIADLSPSPLTTSSTDVVKPNATFILDDSGSMDRDFTPEYVNDSNGSGTAAGCYDSGDDGSGSIADTPDRCEEGDPPCMSPHFNTQYYNPDFTYIPPVNSDGSSRTSMGSPWTSVPKDGFGVQSTSSTNLITGFPDRNWCDSTSGGTCRLNADYTYPSAAFPYSSSANGSPYYYRIVPSEYCDTAELTNCTATTSPTGSFTFPAKVRWCDSAAATNCQARHVGNFIYPKYLGSVNPGSTGVAAQAATATVAILNSGSNNAAGITGVTIDGVAIMSGSVTASGGTNTSSERRNAAEDLCNAINGFSSTPNYQARNTGSGTTCSGSGSETVTIIASTVGPASNGLTVNVLSGAVGTAAAQATITIDSASSGAQLGGGRTIGGVTITSGSTITASGGSSNTWRRSLRDQLRDAINSYSSSPAYTATSSGYSVIISATVAEGANANGRVVVIPIISGISLSISDCSSPSVTDAMCGGVTGGGIPVTITNMSGGSDAILAAVAYRENTGIWSRTNIVSSNNSYPRVSTRTDCLGATCTYAEEMTNFANWYAYYRTRMQMMKSSAGRAFVSLGNDYRVGFITLNPGSNPSGQSPSGYEFVPVNDFDATQKSTWYTRFYSIKPDSSTPLREALSRVGRYYANVTGGINSSMTGDPMQYSCQQNIALLTTDGFWNGNDGENLTGGSIGNQDNVNSGYSTRGDGAYDGGLGGTAGSSSFGSSDTLADVAMYYYKTDLRADGSLGALGTDVGTDNNVPVSGKDIATHQHMTTFTLGLGIDGVMNYLEGYEGSATGDYANIVSGASNCAWAPGVACNWPQARADDPTALDDLWHTAVNGRGTYFSARDPVSLYQGLANALASVAIRTGSAAASSTSSPNITQTDRFIYSSTYRTQLWDGEIIA